MPTFIDPLPLDVEEQIYSLARSVNRGESFTSALARLFKDHSDLSPTAVRNEFWLHGVNMSITSIQKSKTAARLARPIKRQPKAQRAMQPAFQEALSQDFAGQDSAFQTLLEVKQFADKVGGLSKAHRVLDQLRRILQPASHN